MIYSDEFIWLHFPKCAGNKIEKLFSAYYSDQKDIFQDPVGVKVDPTIAWHDSIVDRKARNPEFEPGSRTVICSIRKLPSWLESRYNFEFQRSSKLSHSPELLLEGKFLEANGKENHADIYMKKYLPKAVLNTGNVRFLRKEFFEEDFKAIFSDYIDISKIPDWEYQHKVNVSNSHLPDYIREQLYDSKGSVYEKCPYWRLVEDMAYGS